MSTDSLAEPTEFTIGGIYYFGCDGSHVNEIKAAMPIHPGDKCSASDMNAIKSKAANSVWQTIRCSPTVAVITDADRIWNLYIGLPGRSVTTVAYNPAPPKQVELPLEATSLYQEMMQILSQLLAQNDALDEDTSRGYSLSDNSKLRTKELEFRSWALLHEAAIYDVLRSSSSANQRMIAASALGYCDPCQAQIEALVHASMDEDGAVRNNATRALMCIATAGKDFAAMIPPDQFIDMLNSSTWTDRNKGTAVVMRLSKQDPSVLPKVKEKAMQALAEMSCWDEPHALGARFLLTKVTGLPETRLHQLFLDGDVDAIVKTVGGKDTSAPIALSLPDLGVILKEVFQADQSDNTRSKASEGYRRLLALKADFIQTKLASDYFYSLSFECFHMGQSEAIYSRNNSLALELFKKSLRHAEESRQALQGGHEKYSEQAADDWANYVRATIAYMTGDLGRVEELRLKSKLNEKVLTRLIEGLKKYGSADYARDYAGVTNPSSKPNLD